MLIHDTASNISNAARDQNRGPETLAILSILAVIAAILICCRILARRLSKTPLWIDDYLIIIALVICITCVGVAVRAVHHGAGRHIQRAHPSNVIDALKIIWASQFLYVWCLVFVKLSIIGQLWRIFNVMDRFRWSAYGLSTLVLLWAAACTCVMLLGCRPISAFWRDPGDEHCISAEKNLFAIGIPNIVTDILLIFVPLPFVLRLGFIRTWQRIGVIITFALGGLTTVVSIYRLTIVYRHKESADTTWSLITIIIWSAVEYSVGIVCACIPALAPLVRSVLRRMYHDPIISSARRKAARQLSWPTLSKAKLQRPCAAAKPDGDDDLGGIWIGDERVLLCGRPYDSAERGIPMEVVLTTHMVGRDRDRSRGRATNT